MCLNAWGTYVQIQLLKSYHNTLVKPVELRLKGFTSITFRLFHFKSIVRVFIVLIPIMLSYKLYLLSAWRTSSGLVCLTLATKHQRRLDKFSHKNSAVGFRKEISLIIFRPQNKVLSFQKWQVICLSGTQTWFPGLCGCVHPDPDHWPCHHFYLLDSMSCYVICSSRPKRRWKLYNADSLQPFASVPAAKGCNDIGLWPND